MNEHDSGLLLDLAWLYVVLSFLCIGGTIPLIPDMYRFLVEARALMTPEEFSGYIALAQAAPGPNILYVALFGYHVAGLAGALTTLGAISLGPFLLVVLAAHTARRWHNNPLREVLLRALAPVTVGMMMSGCLLLLRGFNHTLSWALFGCALACFVFLPRIHPLYVLLAGACVGALVQG